MGRPARIVQPPLPTPKPETGRRAPGGAGLQLPATQDPQQAPVLISRRMLFLAVLWAVLWLVLGVSHPAGARPVARLDGLEIVRVEISGLETLRRQDVEHYLFGDGGGVGKALDTGALNRGLRALWERHLIEDLEVSGESVLGGVRLNIRLVERPILSDVEFRGLERIERGEILDAAQRRRLQVAKQEPMMRGDLAQLARLVEELHREKGFHFVEVDLALEGAGEGARRAVFTVRAGDRLKIDDLGFEGNRFYADWRLRLAMRETKRSGLIAGLQGDDFYHPTRLEEDLERLRDLYRKAGFKDVVVRKPEIEIVTRHPGAESTAEQKRRVRLMIPIEEGERWRFGEVSIVGNELFSDQLLLRQLQRPRGGWLRGSTLDAAVETIRQLYASAGYLFAEVETELVESRRGSGQGEGPVADVVIRIDEADQFRVGRIDFEGNEKTRDRVLRREMLLQEGSVMSLTAMQNSLLRIRQLDYFTLHEEEPVRFDFNDEEKKVDLLVRGEEAERTELQYGGGWSEVDGAYGRFSVRTSNFLGRGETLGVSVQAGRRRESYALEYRIPWWLDRPQSLGLRIFDQSRDSEVPTADEFLSDSRGATLSYGRSLGGFNSLRLSYTFADADEVRSLIDPETGELLSSRDRFKTSVLRPHWIYNSLDSRFEPTRGLRASASLDIAGGFLGGDAEYLRPQLELTWFRPLTRRSLKSYFGLHFEAGYLEPLGEPTAGDPKIFPLQRFFLGGDSSIRGFSRGSVVVRNEDGTLRRDGLFPAGGDTKIQLGLEYHLQLAPSLRAVLFADAGGVFDTRGEFGPSQSIDPDLMRYSAGLELRVKTSFLPIPLRLIYAHNLDPLPDETFEQLGFSLGTSF